MKLLKKITVKGVVGDLKKLITSKEITKDCEVMRVVGIASSYTIKETDLGPSVCMKGQFKGVNLLTGEESHSSVAYLPEVAADMVAGALGDEGASANSVEFAFDIGIHLDAEFIRGYEYICKPLIQPTEETPLDRLTATLPDAPKLEAPKAEKPAK